MITEVPFESVLRTRTPQRGKEISNFAVTETKQTKTGHKLLWVDNVLLTNSHKWSYSHDSSIRPSSGGLSCQCFLFEGKVETDNICSRFHIVSDLRLLFRFNVIYCSACAPKLPLNTHGWGPDSCSPVQCRCFNTWISEFRVWAMVSFWLNQENAFLIEFDARENTPEDLLACIR